jgi:predicted ATP-dependent endonuclease of OLD family
MFIHSIKIKNFKGFAEKFSEQEIIFRKPDNELGSGLNIFVGENNSGKSTLFEAIDFLRNGVPKNKNIEDLKNKNSKNGDEMFVEVVFLGNIKNLVTNFSVKDFSSYITEEGDKQKLIARRSSKIYTIKQGKREVEMNPNKIGIWNFNKNQFENPSGIDADFKKFFEMDFIWSDTNPEDITKFGATTICGKLLAEIVNSFKDEEEYKVFQQAHNNAFNNPQSGLKQKLKQVEIETQKVFNEQFGFAGIEFNFDELDIESFFKNTVIKVDDGFKTNLEDKGGGMQRSVALALLQVYADRIIKHPQVEGLFKPFYLFIDEPEICLHPQAQIKLLKSFKRIASNKQIFISTHSIYFIDPQSIQNIYKFGKDEATKSIDIYYDKSNEIRDIKENRTFFLHHRNIFFTNRAVFVEGVDDLERLSSFCAQKGFENLVGDLYLLNGCGSYKDFKKLCQVFNINNYLITDVDYINDKFCEAYKLEKFPDDQWHRQHCQESNYQKIFLENKEKLLSDNILILSRPDITDFLDENWQVFEGVNHQGINIIGTRDEKESELINMLGRIK